MGEASATQEPKPAPSALEDKGVTRALGFHDVSPDFYPAVEALGRFSPDFFAENFHNYFTIDEEGREVQNLEQDIARLEERLADPSLEERHRKRFEERLSAKRLLLPFTQTYGRLAAYRLTRAMEDREDTP